MVDDNSSDRPSALLTKAQRAYLRGERPDYSPSAERDVKRRIRDRIRASAADASLIIEEVEPDEIEKAAEEAATNASALVALAVLIEELSPNYGTGVEGADDNPLETTVSAGIQNGFRKLGHSWRGIDVTVKRGDPLDELAERELSTLSLNELDQIFMAGRITREEYSQENIRRYNEGDDPKGGKPR